MTILRQNAIAQLEKVPEDRLGAVIQFIEQLVKEPESKPGKWDLDQFIMPPTQRGQNADAYVRELRENDRF